MEWLLLVGTVIVGALAFWGALGIWAESLPRPQKVAEVPATPEVHGVDVELPGPEAVRGPALLVTSKRDNVCIQCDLYGASEEPLPALTEIAEEEVELARVARERGLGRAAHLHESLAQGIRQHLGEMGATKEAARKGQ